MLNFSLATLSNEFIVGVAVAAIVISALVASSLFRNVALARAALPAGRDRRADRNVEAGRNRDQGDAGLLARAGRRPRDRGDVPGRNAAALDELGLHGQSVELSGCSPY